jgi:hypothetical protein
MSGGKVWQDGDFTGDGVVDFLDLAQLAQHYNTSRPAPVPAVVAPSESARLFVSHSPTLHVAKPKHVKSRLSNSF